MVGFTNKQTTDVATAKLALNGEQITEALVRRFVFEQRW